MPFGRGASAGLLIGSLRLRLHDFLLWCVNKVWVWGEIDDFIDEVVDVGVDVIFVLLWWNGLCNDDEACFDIIVGDVNGTFGNSNWTCTLPG